MAAFQLMQPGGLSMYTKFKDHVMNVKSCRTLNLTYVTGSNDKTDEVNILPRGPTPNVRYKEETYHQFFAKYLLAVTYGILYVLKQILNWSWIEPDTSPEEKRAGYSSQRDAERFLHTTRGPGAKCTSVAHRCVQHRAHTARDGPQAKSTPPDMATYSVAKYVILSDTVYQATCPDRQIFKVPSEEMRRPRKEKRAGYSSQRGTFSEELLTTCGTGRRGTTVLHRCPRTRPLSPYRGQRIGEASHPGPPFVLTAANVSSYLAHEDYLKSIETDILVMQETRLTVDGQRVAGDNLPEHWGAHWGRDQPVRQGTKKSVLDARQGGVGFLLAACHKGASTARTALGDELHDTGRWHSLTVRVRNSNTLLHVVSLYGFAGANDGGEQAECNEKLILNAIAEAESIGEIPVVIAGDFNVALENSAALTNATMTGKWTDAATAQAWQDGVEPQATYDSGGRTSRIDMLLLNNEAMQAFRAFKVIDPPGHGIKSHKLLEARFDFNVLDYKMEALPKLHRLPVGATALSAEDKEQVIAEVFAQYVEDFYTAWEYDAIDSVWTLWSKIAEDYLVKSAAQSTNNFEILRNHAYYGRGVDRPFQRRKVTATVKTRQGFQLDDDKGEVVKLLNILHQLQHRHQPDLWAKAQRLGLACLRSGFDEYWALEGYPSADELDHLITDVNSVLTRLVAKHRDKLIKKTIKDRAERLRKHPHKVFREFRAPEAPPLTILRQSDGQVTGDLRSIDKELRAAWVPIFNKYGTEKPAPCVDTFFKRYAQHIHCYKQDLNPLTLEDVKSAIGKMDPSSSAGLDGWKPDEFQKLPDEVLELLLLVYDRIENEGTWPSALSRTGISMIPKKAGCGPTDLRPISVAPIAYRVWASARMTHSQPWQRQWIYEHQHGCRAKHSIEDALATISLHIEQAAENKKGYYGIVVDYAKAFDNIPSGLAFELLDKLGMSERLLRPLRGIYRSMQRCFKFGVFLGEFFTSGNGILQGCPLSMLLLNAMQSILSKDLAAESTPVTYADDLTLLTEEEGTMHVALSKLSEFMGLTGQEINTKKTYAFGTVPLVDFSVQDKVVQRPERITILGTTFRFRDTEYEIKVDEGTVQRALNLLHRIRYSGLSFQLRQRLVGGLVLAKVFAGIAVADLSTADERRLRTAVTNTLWKHRSKHRSPGLLLTLPLKGHVMDPAQAPHVRRIQTARRILRNNPYTLSRFQRLLEARLPRRRHRRGGLVETFLLSARRLHVRLNVDPLRLTMNDTTLPITSRKSTWDHHAREVARRAVWQQVEKDRRRSGGEALGIYNGIDKAATMSLYSQLPWRKQSKLRTILVGATWTQERRAHMPHVYEGPECQQCGDACVETLTHMWWQCPRWADIRARHFPAPAPYDTFPRALREFGILPNGFAADIATVQRMMLDVYESRFSK